MKILDLENSRQRLKIFLLWGVLLLVVQWSSAYIFKTSLDNTQGFLLAEIISLLFAAFAGYMTASALKNNTGDKYRR